MAQISPRLFPYFEAAGTRRCYAPGTLLTMQGERDSKLYLICKGRVRVFCTGSGGKEITLRIIGEGQLLGASAIWAQSARETTVLAVNQVEVLVCGIPALLPYMQEEPELNRLVIQVLSDGYSALCRQLKRLTLYDSTQRVVSYLLEQTETPRLDLGISNDTLPYTHEELGVCLNLNRVTVTRILDRLAQDGLIALHPKRIQVLNRKRLSGLLPEDAE